jgi:putative tricarboxylic transport membrane protein
LSERLFLCLLLLGGTAYAYFGWRIEVPFAYDPLGPKALPVFLGFFLAGLSFFSLFFAGKTVMTFTGRVGKLALIVLFYFFTFQFLGFMSATTLSVYCISRLRGASWMQGLLTGLIISQCFYGIFHFWLKVPLPLGRIFRVIG